jgi:uncharacterized protein YndB with AHSA1/START domain
VRVPSRVLVLALAGLTGLGPGTAASASAGAPSGGDGLDPREPSAQSVVYRQETVIPATPEKIWNLLADLRGYASWNPWVVQAEGDVRRGGSATVTVVMNGLRMRAEHTVLTVDPERRFCWRDAGWNAWFVYGQRCRTLTANPDGTVVVTQELLLDGALSGTAAFFLGKAMSDGMAAESAALKERAETS